MKAICTDEMKHIQLDILKNVAKFCDENRIRYYLGFGTMLGAVRHKGFIPWDDYIDILMPRPDYLRFVKVFNKSNDRYEVKSIEIDEAYWNTFAKVFDLQTYMEEPRITVPEKYRCINIDIFPLDGMPKGNLRKKIHLKFQEFLITLYRGSNFNYTVSRKYVDSKGKLAKLKGWLRTGMKFIAITVFHILPTQLLIRHINKNAAKYAFDTAEYVDEAVCDALDRNIKREDFIHADEYVFEDGVFKGTRQYDMYLNHIYGDYMELPPENRRVSHHDFTPYWRENLL